LLLEVVTNRFKEHFLLFIFVFSKIFIFVLGSVGQKSTAALRCYSKRLNSREVSIANRGKLRLKLRYRYQILFLMFKYLYYSRKNGLGQCGIGGILILLGYWVIKINFGEALRKNGIL